MHSSLAAMVSAFQLALRPEVKKTPLNTRKSTGKRRADLTVAGVQSAGPAQARAVAQGHGHLPHGVSKFFQRETLMAASCGRGVCAACAQGGFSGCPRGGWL